MQISLLVPGKLKKSYIGDGCLDYLKRLEHYVRCQVVEVREEPCGKGRNVEVVKRREAERLWGAVPQGAVFIVFDEHGEGIDSVSLADMLRMYRDRGCRQLVFAINKPLKLAPELLEKAHRRIALSHLTFPHELVRLIVLEQFYRAFTIMHGEPYHNP